MPQPGLAIAWHSDPGEQRWYFDLREDASFDDGTAAGSTAVAASLRAANPGWKVVPSGNGIVIERDRAAPDLPAELALERNSIVKREAGRILGSGSFRVRDWQPGRSLSLAAREDYWGGRAFLDAIEVVMGEDLEQQMLALSLGKADLIEVAAAPARATADNYRVEASPPIELLALVFEHAAANPQIAGLRRALGLSLDRQALSAGMLEGAGEPSGSLLPNWMTGYGFLFPSASDLSAARAQVAEQGKLPPWSLSYDDADPVLRLVAERLVLNARDVGLTVELTRGAAELRLVRVTLASIAPRLALEQCLLALGVPRQLAGDSVEQLYAAENSVLQSEPVVPLLHLRQSIAVSNRVAPYHASGDGSWPGPDLWLETDKP
jgi:ABC-type transport system substrate-binding protein